MPVPTSGLGTSVAASSVDVVSQLNAMDAPAELTEALAAAASSPFYPAQLGIANANEYIDVVSQDSTRLFHFLHKDVPTNEYRTYSAVIDKSVRSFQFLVAGNNTDTQGIRIVEVKMPSSGRAWIPISPADKSTPPDWDIRSDRDKDEADYQDVLIVTDPEPGVWMFRARYGEISSDFIMSLSVDSPIRLEGNLLNLKYGMAGAGDVVPIVATLMDHKGLLPGATVGAIVTNEGGTDLTLLPDDGNHNDGAADDGIYGFPYSLTDHGGSYAVRIIASIPNPADPGETLFREWNGGFWIDGPQDDVEYTGDTDKDRMPDDWERRCGLIVGEDDSKGDKDMDQLPNIRELELGTSPCRADTDNGGEQDGSEVRGQRNPLWADDDKAIKITGITLRPLSERIAIGWSQREEGHTNVVLCISKVKGELGDCSDIGSKGDFLLNGLENGVPYYVTLYGEGADGAQGAYSDQMEVMPKEDPIPPQGAFFIGGPNVIEGGDVATDRNVLLVVDAMDTDSEFEGPAGLGSHSLPHGLVGPQFTGMFEASGNVEMRFANSIEEIEKAAWEPLSGEKKWQLECKNGASCTVFGQFRDGAGNESLIVDQRIDLRIPQAACFDLTLSHTGDGADPVVTPANSDGCESGQYVAGESISLSAAPAAGWAVSAWSGTDNDGSTSETNSLTMPAGNVGVGVTYSQSSTSDVDIYLPSVLN